MNLAIQPSLNSAAPKTIDSLAIFSSKPCFSSPIHVGRPNIPDREKFLLRVNEMLDRRWFSNAGPFVEEFENNIATLLGVRHCIAVCNGTVALEIAIRALELKGEVIVPSFTFVATPHALQWQEITPVFCDIDPITHNIDPTKIDRLITPRTTGIIGVHLWGHPCSIHELAEVAARRRIRLMFDASHGFGCTFGGRHIGNFGSLEVFSFHATKFISTFEGGAVVTNDDTLAQRIRLMKNFGFSGYDNVIHLGTNGKMSEISAAMGLTMLEQVDDLRSHNKQRYETYERYLIGIPGVRLLPYEGVDEFNYQYVVAEIDKSLAGVHRDVLLQVLHAENVLARRYFYPGCHRMEPYRSYYPHASLLLPVTERVSDRVLVLPTGPTLAKSDIEVICDLIRLVVEDHPRLNSRLRHVVLDEAYTSSATS